MLAYALVISHPPNGEDGEMETLIQPAQDNRNGNHGLREKKYSMRSVM